MYGVVDILLSHETNKIDKPGNWIGRKFTADKHVPDGKDDFGNRVDAKDVPHESKELSDEGLGDVVFSLLFEDLSVD